MFNVKAALEKVLMLMINPNNFRSGLASYNQKQLQPWYDNAALENCLSIGPVNKNVTRDI
jgi:hypothetical protein